MHAREELGIDPDDLPSAMWAAGLSLACFLFGAFLPLIPWYIGGGSNAAWASLTIGVIAAGFVGGIVARLAERKIVSGVIRQILIVLVACAVTYLIGELVGVNFDRCFEATINDFAWDQSYSRSIGVDIRYVLWVIESVQPCQRLMQELLGA